MLLTPPKLSPTFGAIQFVQSHATPKALLTVNAPPEPLNEQATEKDFFKNGAPGDIFLGDIYLGRNTRLATIEGNMVTANRFLSGPFFNWLEQLLDGSQPLFDPAIDQEVHFRTAVASEIPDMGKIEHLSNLLKVTQTTDPTTGRAHFVLAGQNPDKIPPPSRGEDDSNDGNNPSKLMGGPYRPVGST